MEIQIKDNCLLCNKKFDWHEVVIGKLPENIWFCDKCITKFKDEKKYQGIEAWMTLEYEPGLIVENKDY